MLAHSPLLSFVINYRLNEDDDIAVEGEEGAILAFRQYDRVRRVRLLVPVTSRRKLVLAKDDEDPILEYLIIGQKRDTSSILIFPNFFKHYIYTTSRYLVLPFR